MIVFLSIIFLILIFVFYENNYCDSHLDIITVVVFMIHNTENILVEKFLNRPNHFA